MEILYANAITIYERDGRVYRFANSFAKILLNFGIQILITVKNKYC